MVDSADLGFYGAAWRFTDFCQHLYARSVYLQLVLKSCELPGLSEGAARIEVVIPAVEAGLERGTLIKQHAESFGNQKFEILKSYIRHPVQKQGRPVPHGRLGQHSGKAECLKELERTNRNAGNAMRCTGSPKGENAGCSRVNHFARGLDAIRDSRIAFRGWLSGHSLITFGIRDSQPVRS